jgi:hypothetical protein
MTDRTDRDFVYGVYSLHDCFAVWDAPTARQTSDEIDAVKACGTVGALRALTPTLTRISPPLDVDDIPDEPDDTPWCWWNEGAVCDGDWPTMPTQQTLTTLPSPLLEKVLAATGGYVIETSYNGPYVDIPVTKEAELLTVLNTVGCAYRDDLLIDSLGMQ